MHNRIRQMLLKNGFTPFADWSYGEYEPYKKQTICSELTYVMLKAYDEDYPFYLKKVKNALVIVEQDYVKDVYTAVIPLIEEELPDAITEVVDLMRKIGFTTRIGSLTQDQAGLVKNHPYVSGVSYDIDYSDYVYDISEYLDLKGKENSHKRRDMNRMKAEFPNIRVDNHVSIRENKDLLIGIMQKWCNAYDCEKCVYGCEKDMFCHLLDSDLIEHLYASVMYIDDKPEMMAVAENIGDTCYLYYKKSVNRIQGAFYYFEHEFLKALSGVTYVNFGEDMGLPGLREYKTRRHPIRMIHKYTLEIKEE